jgi:hypothetical protein
LKLERTVTIIAVVVVVAIFTSWYYAATLTFNSSATIIIVAQTPSNYYYSPKELNATVDFDGKMHTMPLTLQLGDGTYLAVFQPLQWYSTPPSENFTVFYLSQSSYFTVIYTPVPAVFALTQTGLNATIVQAKSGVTPVTWLDETNSPVTLTAPGIGSEPIAPGGNYTTVFDSPGSVAFQISGGATGTVNVV